ncbi:glycosyl hydrolase 6-domain-containing protein [Fusarium redolens]|uniref:Glycosyl hydrolase 6-domain-containing protein n=1 Tax=Fusarium redolens TaxID=48865 RepID=A0A9P9HCF7_FUSRE|nr:glycosyl hydrolase 6-domain-containing protein [Fusarium redolens]KAH7255124.1 glycosyl hydrolase 6-domain-containing protein [Fusarium redolens]
MTVPAPTARRWWHEPFSVVQTNLREIDAEMDVEAVANWIKGFGATAWLCGVGGIQAQYPSELSFQMRNPHLAERTSGDLVGDALAAAHTSGLKFLARMDFSKIAPHVAAEHPEWCYVSPLGNIQEHTAGLVSVCPSGGYYQERIFDILQEVTERYNIDGLFFNWATMNEEDYHKVYHGVCHCVNCQSLWLDFAQGLELPKGPQDTNYGIWLIFSRKIIDGITAKIRTFIAERLPQTALIRGETADIIYQESNNEIGRDFWHHSTSEWISSWISYRPNVPVLANSTCFLDMRYRMAGEEPAQFAQYLLQCISRGGTPSTYMMGTPGKIPYPCLDIARDITQFHSRHHDTYRNFIPCALTGLVRPSRGWMTGKTYQQSVSEFRGIYSALQEMHIPFDVVALEHLSGLEANSSLSRYRNLILPDLGHVPMEYASIFDRWVDQTCGTLICTGSSGQEEAGSIQIKCLPVRRRRAVVAEGKLLWSSYVAPPQKKKGIHYYNGPTIPLFGAASYFEWKEESVKYYKILSRAPFAPPEKAYGNIEIDQPGYGMAPYGSGKCCLIPFTVGRGYRETGLSCQRDFFLQVFRQHATPERLTFHLAEQVEITMHRSGDRIVLHLVNMSGARKLNFGAHIPITQGSIQITGDSHNVSAEALRRGQKLEINDGTITLPELDLFEVVVIEGLL